MTRWLWSLKRIMRGMWFRTTLFSLLGIVTALFAAWFQHWIPKEWTGVLGEGAVDSILQIMAASMLAVTTFSLNILVSAYASASSAATPRATELLINDTAANNALSTFLGAFLFSIVGIITLRTGLYREEGRVLLFLVTIGMIVLIVATLLHWINYLSTLGRMGHTIARLEEIACDEVRSYLRDPYRGGTPWQRRAEPLPTSAIALHAPKAGHVQWIDVAMLQELLLDYTKQSSAPIEHAGQPKTAAAQIYVMVLPGQFVAPGSTPLCSVVGLPVPEDEQAEQATQDFLARLRDAFTIAPSRTFDSDPRFGLVAMAEVASKALSAAVNDCGTAIDVINRSLRIFELWAQLETPAQPATAPSSPTGEHEVRYPNVKVPAVALEDVFDDFFPPVGRDGAAQREVGIRLQKMLISLYAFGGPEMQALARSHAQQALQRNLAAMDFPPDREAVEAVHRQVWPAGQ